MNDSRDGIVREPDPFGDEPRETSIDDIWGTVSCRECGEVWVKEFVPEFCTRCGTRVTDKPGHGLAQLIEAIESQGLEIDTFTCPYCGERYPGGSPLAQCLRCNGRLDPAMQVRWRVRRSKT